MRYVGRENVRKRFAPLEGRPGRTVYAGGEARIDGTAVRAAGEARSEELRGAAVRAGGNLRTGDARTGEARSREVVVRPSFGLAHVGEYDSVHVAPLLEEIARDHLVAVLLVRLGGYAVGMLEGERVVTSKVGSRFVKNRHKKGGSSSNRFRRRREEQARALLEEAADVAAAVLRPAPFAALGGDRAAVEGVLAARADLAWLRERAIGRFLTTEEPRLRTLEALPYDLYAVGVSG